MLGLETPVVWGWLLGVLGLVAGLFGVLGLVAGVVGLFGLLGLVAGLVGLETRATLDVVGVVGFDPKHCF